MSEIRVTNVIGENGNSPVNFTKGINMSGICTATAFIPSQGQLSHRNKVDNGSFLINQRGGSFTSTSSEYMMDRFEHVQSGGITFDTTTTQDSSGPVGFRKCLKITPDSTQTPTGGQNAMIQHKIEGQDLQDLCFGTSSAKKITLSFYAKSAAQNNNHQYTLQIRKYDDSNNRNMINRAFTVTSSWQRFTMTFDGDTAENIRNDNAVGMQLLWHLADGPDDIHAQVNTFGRTTNSSFYTAVTGQSNFMDNTNNEFYLTGIQLEVGSAATPFEHRSIGEELARCQRYFYKWVSSEAYSNMCLAYAGSSTQVETVFNLPVVMRASPSFEYSGQFRFVGYNPQNVTNLSNLVVHRSHPLTPYLRGTVSGSASGLVGELGDSGSNDAAALFSAEL